MKPNDKIKKHIAILIFACDRYELLFKGFDYFFIQYWDNSLLLTKYFTTEQVNLNLEGYINLKSGYGQWTDRLRIILDRIEEDYIIFLQEDMWFKKRVPSKILESILQYTLKNELNLVKLHSSEVYKTEKTTISFDGYVLSKIIKEKSNFLMSHQVSVWKKSFLYEQLVKNEHPWRNERRGSKRLKKSKKELFQIDLLSENGKPPINKNHYTTSPGEYHTISVNACIHPKAKIFIPELTMAFPEYAQKIKYHLENQITHDGKPQPRKKDIFKRIKTAIQIFLQK